MEKNPNAVVTLQNRVVADGWQGTVTIVPADMREWEAPEQADILVRWARAAPVCVWWRWRCVCVCVCVGAGGGGEQVQLGCEQVQEGEAPGPLGP